MPLLAAYSATQSLGANRRPPCTYTGAAVSFGSTCSYHGEILRAPFHLVPDLRGLTGPGISVGGRGEEMALAPIPVTLHPSPLARPCSLHQKKAAPMCAGVRTGELHMFICCVPPKLSPSHYTLGAPLWGSICTARAPCTTVIGGYPEWVGFYPITKCPLRRGGHSVQDLCKHPSVLPYPSPPQVKMHKMAPWEQPPPWFGVPMLDC